ncbi:unnamed protein product [Urochloa humidicola]
MYNICCTARQLLLILRKMSFKSIESYSTDGEGSPDIQAELLKMQELSSEEHAKPRRVTKEGMRRTTRCTSYWQFFILFFFCAKRVFDTCAGSDLHCKGCNVSSTRKCSETCPCIIVSL